MNLGQLGSKTSSQGQITEIPCGCSRGHILCLIELKFGQNVCLNKITEEFEFRSFGVEN